jgi:hypothetical protein
MGKRAEWGIEGKSMKFEVTEEEGDESVGKKVDDSRKCEGRN